MTTTVTRYGAPIPEDSLTLTLGSLRDIALAIDMTEVEVDAIEP